MLAVRGDYTAAGPDVKMKYAAAHCVVLLDDVGRVRGLMRYHSNEYSALLSRHVVLGTEPESRDARPWWTTFPAHASMKDRALCEQTVGRIDQSRLREGWKVGIREAGSDCAMERRFVGRSIRGYKVGDE